MSQTNFKIKFIANEVVVIGKNGVMEVTLLVTRDEIKQIAKKVEQAWQSQASITSTK